MKYLLIFLFIPFLLFVQCSKKEEESKMSSISQSSVDKVIRQLTEKYGEQNKFRIERGVKQVASFWMEEDGVDSVFENFCMKNFVNSPDTLLMVFNRLSDNFETLYGHYNKITLDLNRPLHLDIGTKFGIDELFGAYSPSAHLTDDFYKNKIAFYILLNFPHYSLQEKTEQGPNWSRQQWAFARMGDVFTSRVPANVQQKVSEALSASDSYISDYNIYMGYLINDKGDTLFPKDLRLLTHWNLRDEIKSQYAKPDGLQRQRMIYEVMTRIINQDIPSEVINKHDYQWNPFKNKLYKDGKEVKANPEPDTRYEMLLNNFLAVKQADPYCPYYPTYIKRKFEEELEIPIKKAEDLFIKFVSAPTVKQIAGLIKQRLNRNLEPFDIWYDGFKSRSTINEDELNKITRAKYPNTEAFAKDMPNILTKLGYTPEKANYIASKVEVDAARGSGHAWGAQMRTEKAHLRTRIGKEGMDYKGYNIAVHEFGHNTEQTLTLYDMDYYMLNGVPNTAFTEAMAFLFQARDLDLLGIKQNNPDKQYYDALDNFWMTYEIMGVSLVDMRVWQWMYDHPNATKSELKAQVVTIAKEVWNKYYADVFGIKDQPILAIYSHMIDNPLYLSAYPIGHLIEFQLEKYIEGKNLATEMQRVLAQGRIIPELWMKGAVGSEISIEPMINAANEALTKVK